MTGVLPWSAPLWRPEVVEKEAEELVEERQQTHGVWAGQARLARRLKRAVEEYDHSLTDGQREAVDFILVKISRIVSGDAAHDDHWLDIIGYAHLGRDST